MALISHSKKFIFVHIYKTAGTAITDSLIEYSCQKDRIAHDYYITRKLANAIDRLFNSWDNGRKWLTGYHKHATALELREVLGIERFNEYYKFAFIRNPWDWMTSLYFYIKRENTHIYHRLANKLTFKEFLQFYLQTDPPLQLDFLTDSQGKIIVDKIGRFENLYHDFYEIYYQINRLDRSNAQAHLGIKNMSLNRQRDYKIYYDSESIALVENYFKRDIEFFGFEFDPSRKEQKIISIAS